MEAPAVIARTQPVTLVFPVPPGNTAGVGAEPMPGFVVLAECVGNAEPDAVPVAEENTDEFDEEEIDVEEINVEEFVVFGHVRGADVPIG